MTALGRLAHAWNAFTKLDDDPYPRPSFYDGGNMGRPDRVRFLVSNERSIVSSIYNKLAVDVSSVHIRHVKLDENDRFKNEIKSGFNNCLKLKANIDQGARAFLQDAVMTLFDKGVIALVPVETTLNPGVTSGYDILNMRVGHIIQWYPKHVKVSVYNELNGKRQEIVLDKNTVAVVENPFYSVMNEQNSTLQRLIRKLNILDAIDEQTGSGKLDLIIQLPYVIKSDARKQQAIQRREDIEFQLKGSKYGIAYTDGTEKITQLNRPAENNLLGQIEWLTGQLYSQLGLTPEIMNGTANEETMLNYMSRTVEPVLDAIVESMKATFLTKTARSQGQSVEYFRDPFKLVPVSKMADIADKFTRNEIFTSNEIRSFMGYRPSTDPKADLLRNSNMPDTPAPSETAQPDPTNQEGDSQNGSNSR